MKLKETRILDAAGARYACIANDYCTRCDCEEDIMEEESKE